MMFREYDGKVSFARVTCFILMAFYIIASLIVLVKNNFASIPDIPVQLAGLITLLYASNKGADVLKKKKAGGKNGTS